MTNLANINSADDLTNRGKAWADFYTSTQGNNIKTFAIQYLLDLDSVKDNNNDVPISGNDNKGKATAIITIMKSNPIIKLKLVNY